MNLFNLFRKPIYLVHYKFYTKCERIDGYGSLVFKGSMNCRRILELKELAESNLKNDNGDGDEFKFNVVIVNICKIR